MKRDIKTRSDIEIIVNEFYEKVKIDDVLSTFFTDVIPVNWDKHIPLMIAFWENVLLYTGDYDGNPLVTHRKIHAIESTTSVHFTRWLKLFDETVNTNFYGPNATKMKEHSKAIASVMISKI